ncbi:hypothetical protein [Aeromonas media]|uniref:hypothetical protein n=1 Tax=Aeromonas media TaxID=651 RepID=UPI0038CFFA60
MDAKDQRLEVRVSQQQLVDLDTIRSSVDSNYIPTRSDVVRSFIDQGIARHLGGGERALEKMPLGQRLSLYFQIQQTYLIENPNRNPTHTLNGASHKKSEITELALVRQVYLRRMFWFFELDKKSLNSIHHHLGNDAIISLLNSEADVSTCRDLAYVSEVINMFREIEKVVEKGKQEIEYNESNKTLARIDYLSERLQIPLKFKGFPKDRPRLVEMSALLNWVDNGEGQHYIRVQACTTDHTAMYEVMLGVYQEITRDKRGLSLPKLLEMLEDRRLESV